VSAGADIYHPSLAYLLAISGAMVAFWSGSFIEKRLRVDDAVGAVAVHGVAGFYGVLLVGIFAGGYPTGINNIESSMGGQLMGVMAFIPLAFLPGYFVSWLLKKGNLLRVPAEVELEGLDMAEFGADFYPEFERVPEVIVEPDGHEVEGAPVLLDSYWQTQAKVPAGTSSES
jgi:ammonia channel protein AmtB